VNIQIYSYELPKLVCTKKSPTKIIYFHLMESCFFLFVYSNFYINFFLHISSSGYVGFLLLRISNPGITKESSFKVPSGPGRGVTLELLEDWVVAPGVVDWVEACVVEVVVGNIVEGVGEVVGEVVGNTVEGVEESVVTVVEAGVLGVADDEVEENEVVGADDDDDEVEGTVVVWVVELVGNIVDGVEFVGVEVVGAGVAGVVEAGVDAEVAELDVLEAVVAVEVEVVGVADDEVEEVVVVVEAEVVGVADDEAEEVVVVVEAEVVGVADDEVEEVVVVVEAEVVGVSDDEVDTVEEIEVKVGVIVLGADPKLPLGRLFKYCWISWAISADDGWPDWRKNPIFPDFSIILLHWRISKFNFSFLGANESYLRW
jgi:hypothetical protein